ncbi:MAG: Uma2 family endonuclease [Candidatus Methylumidiphilus sp.]
MRPQHNTSISPAEYLSMERLAETKSEYANGEIFAMAGASREHNQIASNIVANLSNQLLERPCSVYASDMKVSMASAKHYAYPDIVGVCGPQQFEDEHTDVLLNPSLIIEILSDSTEAYDRGLKFFRYQRLPSLREYLLVAQKFCQVELYQRQHDGRWAYAEFHSMDDIVSLDSIHCLLPLQAVYQKVALSETLI